MRKLVCFTTALFLLVIFSFPSQIFSSAEDGKCSTMEECDSIVGQYQMKLNELGKAKDTLATQLKIIDSQIKLTQLKINQTEINVKALENEIVALTVKIDNLDIDLNKLSSIYINQINQNYKLQKRIPQISIFTSSNFNSLLQQYKYLSIIQKNSQNTLLTMETTRTNYDIQKTEKAKKQEELEALQKTLANQQVSLDKQKKTKNSLLEATKNDESKYQSLINQALAQLSAFRSFSSSAGGETCLSSEPGGGSDGNFFSQRDPRWCKQVIGFSCNNSRTCAYIGGDGCYISSTSMVLKKFGQNISPSAYASDTSNFYGLTALMKNPPNLPSGFNFRQTRYSSGTVDNELRNNRYVIAELSAFSGTHFIVIISGNSGSYKIHDPWFGPDQNLNDHYSTSQIISLRLVTK